MKKILFLAAFCSVAFSQSPNFFYSYLVSGVTASDTLVTFTASDTSYVLTNTGFYATIFDTRYADAADAYKAGRAEVVLVNSRSSNVFNIDRAQLGTTARAFNTSGRRYKIVASVYGASIPQAISSATSGLFLTNNGTTTAWDTIYQQADIVIPIALASNFGSQATNFAAFASGSPLSTSSTSGSDVNHQIFGITGTVVGLVVNYRANNKNAADSVILWKNNAITSVRFTIDAGGLNGADTVNTVGVLPTDRWQLKLVNSSGSGTSTGISAALRIRLNLRK